MLFWKNTSYVEEQKGVSVSAGVKSAVTPLFRSSWLLHTCVTANALFLCFGADHPQPALYPSDRPKRRPETHGEEPPTLQKMPWCDTRHGESTRYRGIAQALF